MPTKGNYINVLKGSHIRRRGLLIEKGAKMAYEKGAATLMVWADIAPDKGAALERL